MSKESLEPLPPQLQPPPTAEALKPHPAAESPAPISNGRTARWLNWRACTALLAIAASLTIWWAIRSHANLHDPANTAQTLQPVTVTRVVREDLRNQIPYPAEFRPYMQVELHAKVSGYVDQINVDIGDKVKAGQLLAKLELPELKNELDRAQAAANRAAADYKDAHLVFTRLSSVIKERPNLLAQQELDAAEAKDSVADSALAAAKAEVGRYETMLGYTRITAPFDGVITHRYADPGSLIQAGTTSDTQSLPLVRLSDNYKLRLDFPVSVAYVKDIHVGDQVDVRVDSLGGKHFTFTITRTTMKVDDDTRTMTVEIELPNPDLEIVPGMYANLLLDVEKRQHVLTVPTEALAGGEQNSVYLVNDKNEIETRSVKLGLETPTKYEVTAGLKEGELVLVAGRSHVKPGQKVEVTINPALAIQ
jgi:RND family efflux transporter MFP subunit